MRMGKDRKSPGKTDVPKLYTYNECELYVRENSISGRRQERTKVGESAETIFK